MRCQAFIFFAPLSGLKNTPPRRPFSTSLVRKKKKKKKERAYK